MFSKSINALLSSIKAREEGRPGIPRPPPIIMPQTTTLPAQQAQYNRYDQERFIRQKEGEYDVANKITNNYVSKYKKNAMY